MATTKRRSGLKRKVMMQSWTCAPQNSSWPIKVESSVRGTLNKVVWRPVMMMITDQVRKKDEVDEPYRKNRMHMLTTNAEALWGGIGKTGSGRHAHHALFFWRKVPGLEGVDTAAEGTVSVGVLFIMQVDHGRGLKRCRKRELRFVGFIFHCPWAATAPQRRAMNWKRDKENGIKWVRCSCEQRDTGTYPGVCMSSLFKIYVHLHVKNGSIDFRCRSDAQ